MFQILISAARETVFMVVSASLLSICIGIPFGILVANFDSSNNRFLKAIYYVCAGIMELIKSTPFLLLMLLFIPLTNWLINHRVPYTTATILPLTTAGSLILASRVYRVVAAISAQWHATGKSMGASKTQILHMIVLPECFHEIIQSTTNTCSLIVGLTTIAGALGAGGLGQLAIEKSIEQPNILYVLLSLLILVTIQQLIQFTGTRVAKHIQAR